MKYETTVEGKTFIIEIKESGEVLVDGESYMPDFRSIDGLSLYSLLVENTSYEMLVEEESGHFHVLAHGEAFAVRVRETLDVGVGPREQPAPVSGPVELKSPIPGVVVDVAVAPGEKAAAGQVLLILESMKMENELRAPGDGTVKEVHALPGDDVNRGQLLIVFDVA